MQVKLKKINSYNEKLIYDKNGNIMSFNRRGSHNAFNQVIDLLTYQYNGNQLQNVVENPMGNASAGFIDGNIHTSSGLNDYTYDPFGNMTIENNKKITYIRYNHLNLPTEIVFNNNQQTKINYPCSRANPFAWVVNKSKKPTVQGWFFCGGAPPHRYKIKNI
jgi:hypothetical protein